MHEIRSFIDYCILLENRAEKRIQHLTKQGVPEDHARQIADVDPTPEKKYVGWLHKQYKSGAMPADNEGEQAEHHELLTHWQNLHPKLPEKERDINRYKTRGDAEHHLIDSGHLGEKEFDQDGYKGYKIDSEGAANYHTKQNDCLWCTGKDNSEHVEDYLRRGSLHVIHAPNGDSYQFSPPKGEIADGPNVPVDPHEVEKKHPVLKHHRSFQEFKNHEWQRPHDEDEDEDEGEENHHDMIHRLAHSPDPSERVDAVDYDAIEQHGHEHLLDDPEPEVRQAIIRHFNDNVYDEPYDRDSIHDRYKDDPEPDVRATVAEHARHPDIIDHMMEHHSDNPTVAKSLSHNSFVPTKHLHTLAEKHSTNHGILTKLINHPRSDEDLRETAYNAGKKIHDMDWNSEEKRRFYQTVARNLYRQGRSMHADHIKNDMAHQSSPIHARIAIAQYHGDELPHLKNDPNENVRYHMATHFPKDMVKNPDPMVRRHAVREVLGQDFDHVMNHAVNDSDPRVRQQVAVRTTNQMHLNKLADDPDIGIRQEVLRRDRDNHFNGHVAVERLHKFAHTTDPTLALSVSNAVNRYPYFNGHEAFYRHAANAPRPEIRLAAAAHGDHEVHRKLMHDSDPRVRQNVAIRSKDTGILTHLMSDSNNDVKYYAGNTFRNLTRYNQGNQNR